MRNLRFRVWLPNEQLMCELSLVDLKKSFLMQRETVDVPLSVIGQFDGHDKRVRDYVLIPFTGLKDRRGTDIYEGDLVRGVPISSFFEHLGVIEFGDYRVIFLNAGEVYGSSYAYGYYIHWLYPGRIRNILCQDDEENTDPLHQNIEVVGNISTYYDGEEDQ